MDIITLGIGPDSDIEHLVLTGLGVLESPSDIPSEIGLIPSGYLETLFSSYLSEGGVASDFGVLPGEACQISWQTNYASEPSSAAVSLQVSLNGLNWSTIDTTTDTLGEIRQVYTSAKFVRAIFGAMEEGIGTTVTIVVQIVPYVPLEDGSEADFMHQATLVLTDAQIKALPVTPVQIVAAPGANRVIVAQALVGAGGFVLTLDWTADYTNVSAAGTINIFTGSTSTGEKAKYGVGARFADFFAWGAADPIWIPGAWGLLDGDMSDAAQSLNSISDYADKALFIAIGNAALGAFTGGNVANSMRVSLMYSVLNLITGEFE